MAVVRKQIPPNFTPASGVDPDLEKWAREFDVVETIELERVPGTSHATDLQLEVDVDEGEEVLVLVERDGVLEWKLPIRPSGSGFADSDATRRFTIAEANPSGSLASWIGDRIKAVVVRFVVKRFANWTARQIVKRLERDLVTGPVRLEGDTLGDLEQWGHHDRFPTLSGRTLLLVHGTFSSTAGSFGGLTATPHGQALLQHWRQRYDHIVGFDHATLSEDPVENAAMLYDALQRAGRPGALDIVCFSRGGLVTRVLTQEVFDDDWYGSVGSIGFVATTNGGTLLATPDNWKNLLDITTNLVTGSMRLASLINPAWAGITASIGALASGVGVFAKALTVGAMEEDGSVPGLAAMVPDGPLVARLNGARPLPGTLHGFTSAFDTGQIDYNADTVAQTGLPKPWLLRTGKTVGLMMFQGSANDLVVHNDSVKVLGDRRLDSLLALPHNGQVMHTNHFFDAGIVEGLRSIG